MTGVEGVDQYWTAAFRSSIKLDFSQYKNTVQILRKKITVLFHTIFFPLALSPPFPFPPSCPNWPAGSVSQILKVKTRIYKKISLFYEQQPNRIRCHPNNDNENPPQRGSKVSSGGCLSSVGTINRCSDAALLLPIAAEFRELDPKAGGPAETERGDAAAMMVLEAAFNGARPF